MSSDKQQTKKNYVGFVVHDEGGEVINAASPEEEKLIVNTMTKLRNLLPKLDIKITSGSTYIFDQWGMSEELMSTILLDTEKLALKTNTDAMTITGPCSVRDLVCDMIGQRRSKTYSKETQDAILDMGCARCPSTSTFFPKAGISTTVVKKADGTFIFRAEAEESDAYCG
jgi:hypothetical protein